MQNAATVGAVAAFPAIVPARVLGKDAPSNTVNVAQIGCGRIGITMDVPGFLRAKGARIAAVCDLDSRRLDYMRSLVAQKQGEKSPESVFAARDFHEVISRSDVDAVSISTPDHWHAQIAIESASAGKHVYMQKPASLETERIYTWSDHCYVNPMPLYEKPLELKSGDNFTLDYEVSVF